MARNLVAENNLFDVRQANLRLASGEGKLVEKTIEGRIAIFKGHLFPQEPEGGNGGYGATEQKRPGKREIQYRLERQDPGEFQSPQQSRQV